MLIEVYTTLLLYSSCRPCRHVCSCLFSLILGHVPNGWRSDHGLTNIRAIVQKIKELRKKINQVPVFVIYKVIMGLLSKREQIKLEGMAQYCQTSVTL